MTAAVIQRETAQIAVKGEAGLTGGGVGLFDDSQTGGLARSRGRGGGNVSTVIHAITDFIAVTTGNGSRTIHCTPPVAGGVQRGCALILHPQRAVIAELVVGSGHSGGTGVILHRHAIVGIGVNEIVGERSSCCAGNNHTIGIGGKLIILDGGVTGHSVHVYAGRVGRHRIIYQ